jgi:hypothetical protein
MMRLMEFRRRKLPSSLTAAVVSIGLLATPAWGQGDAEVGAYGTAGSTELSVQLGFGSNYFAGGAGLRYFVVDGIAPGFEGSYQQSHGIGQGLAMGSLRLAPVRFGSVIPVITGRAGRVLLTEHASGWAVGGDAGIVIVAGPHVAFELGYGFLRLMPDSFCADLATCTIYQPSIGLRITF